LRIENGELRICGNWKASLAKGAKDAKKLVATSALGVLGVLGGGFRKRIEN